MLPIRQIIEYYYILATQRMDLITDAALPVAAKVSSLEKGGG